MWTDVFLHWKRTKTQPTVLSLIGSKRRTSCIEKTCMEKNKYVWVKTFLFFFIFDKSNNNKSWMECLTWLARQRISCPSYPVLNILEQQIWTWLAHVSHVETCFGCLFHHVLGVLLEVLVLDWTKQNPNCVDCGLTLKTPMS